MSRRINFPRLWPWDYSDMVLVHHTDMVCPSSNTRRISFPRLAIRIFRHGNYSFFVVNYAHSHIDWVQLAWLPILCILSLLSRSMCSMSTLNSVPTSWPWLSTLGTGSIFWSGYSKLWSPTWLEKKQPEKNIHPPSFSFIFLLHSIQYNDWCEFVSLFPVQWVRTKLHLRKRISTNLLIQHMKFVYSAME